MSLAATAAAYASYRNGGPVVVDLNVTLTPTEDGTRLHSRFEVRPNGFFKVIFPIFLRVMKRQENARVTIAKRVLESKMSTG